MCGASHLIFVKADKCETKTKYSHLAAWWSCCTPTATSAGRWPAASPPCTLPPPPPRRRRSSSPAGRRPAPTAPSGCPCGGQAWAASAWPRRDAAARRRQRWRCPLTVFATAARTGRRGRRPRRCVWGRDRRQRTSWRAPTAAGMGGKGRRRWSGRSPCGGCGRPRNSPRVSQMRASRGLLLWCCSLHWHLKCRQFSSGTEGNRRNGTLTLIYISNFCPAKLYVSYTNKRGCDDGAVER